MQHHVICVSFHGQFKSTLLCTNYGVPQSLWDFWHCQSVDSCNSCCFALIMYTVRPGILYITLSQGILSFMIGCEYSFFITIIMNKELLTVTLKPGTQIRSSRITITDFVSSIGSNPWSGKLHPKQQ